MMDNPSECQDVLSFSPDQQALGDILSQARRANSLNVQDVADRLYLTKSWVQGIEESDFSMIPTVQYARLYVRSYAKLLSLPEDKIMAAFDAIGLQDRQDGVIVYQPLRKKSALWPALSAWCQGHWRWVWALILALLCWGLWSWL